MELTSLLSFEFRENCIQTAKGSYYFFRVKPPNFSTLSREDKNHHCCQFEDMLRSITDIPFSILALDQTVNLDENRRFVSRFDARFENIKRDLTDSLLEFADGGGNTERAYYFVIRTKQPQNVERFRSRISGNGMSVTLAGKDMLVDMMRGFLLREFVDRGIYTGEQDAPADEPAKETGRAAEKAAGKAVGKDAGGLSPLVRHILPTQLSFEINCVIQPGLYRKTLVVRNLPQDITSDNNGFLRAIVQHKNCTVMTRVDAMPPAQVTKLVDKQFGNATVGLFRRRQTQVLEAERDADALASFYRDTLAKAGDGSVKYVNIFVELYGKTQKELEEAANSFSNTCRAWGVTLEEFTLRQKEGYIGVSPIGSDTRSILLANNIPSSTMGQLYPFSASYLNDPHGMQLGRTVDNGIISVDINYRDAMRTNGNILLVGAPGQGKSYVIKKMIPQLYLSGFVCFVIDSENEFGDEIVALGGTNINCARGKYVINMFQVRSFRAVQDDDDDDDDFDPTIEAFQRGASPLLQHLSWLSDFFKVLIPDIDAVHLAALRILVQDVYERANITDQTDFSKLSPEDYPIMSDVYEYIELVLSDRKAYPFYQMLDDAVLKRLLLLLYDVYKGSLSQQFNKHSNITNSDLINININELLAGSEEQMQAVLFNYLTYIWSRTMTRTQRIFFAIDEVYLLMNRDNPTVVKYLNSFSRRARKYEGHLLVATQRIMDCLDKEIVHHTAAVFDIPTYKFLFYPGNIDLQTMQAKLNLNDAEVESIRYSNKGHCLFKCGNDNYDMVIGTLPYEKELFGVGGGR